MKLVEAIRSPAGLFAASALTVVAIYWIGLQGPFVLDDSSNFSGIRRWLAGTMPLEQVVFGNVNWLDHRAVAMASFAANASIFGYDPFAFKLGNLILHVACGLLIYGVLARLLVRDPQLGERANLVAALVTSVWMLHPFFVSTVLYAVQRMTELSALFCLLALWLYVIVRDRLDHGQHRFSLVALFGVWPALLLLGIQSKQNAAALPLLCLIVELAWYRNPRQRPPAIKVFFATFLGLPMLALGAIFLLKPQLLLAGYAEYDFTPWQRLLSEARVLCDYLRQLIFPHTPAMGISTDDFQPSRGMLSPPSTALSIGLLVMLTVSACMVRRRFPAIFAGWMFFLAAHSVESTFLPLELYYEHRNYLPSIGAFLACASLLSLAGARLAAAHVRVERVGAVCIAVLILTLALLTHGRARVWSDPLVLAESELRNHPTSARAALNYVGIASDLGDIERAYAVIDQIVSSAADPRLRGRLLIFRSTLDCRHSGGARIADVHTAVETLPSHFDLGTFLPLDYLVTSVDSGQCGELDRVAMAQLLARVADRASAQPDDFKLKWGLRNRAAILFAREGHWDDAIVQARKGWQPSTPGRGAEDLVRIFLVSGTLEEAEKVYQQALTRTQGDPISQQSLSAMTPLIAKERESPGWNRRREGIVNNTR